MIRAYQAAGVRHIVALRGDPTGGVGERYAPHPGGYQNAADLVAGIKRIADIEVSVSAYPEKHPDSADRRRRHRHAQGESRCRRHARHHAVLLRERSVFPLSRSRARARDRDSRSCRASCRCRISSRRRISPRAAARRFRPGSPSASMASDEDVATRKLIAAAVAAEQVLDLVDRGVTDFHFYTMNRADLVYAICHLLGLRPARRTSRLKSERSRASVPHQSPKCDSDAPTLAAERILVLDGAMGTMIQGLKLDEARLSRRALRRLAARRARQQRPADPERARRRARHAPGLFSSPAPTSSRPTRFPRPRSRRPITAWKRSSPSSTAKARGWCARPQAGRAGGRPPALCRRRHRADQPHRVDVARREQSGLPRGDVRSIEGGLRRAGEASASTAASMSS